MSHKITRPMYKGMFIRLGTTDKNVVEEVLVTKCYRMEKLDFDVRRGEKWLDFGANIGAFARYCQLARAAEVTSVEPDPYNFQCLKDNLCNNRLIKAHRLRPRDTKRVLIKGAVVAVDEGPVAFYTFMKSDETRSRSSTLQWPGFTRRIHVLPVPIHRFHGEFWDGIKMDIEGGEFDILDKRLLPKTRKLVFEYHTSRDPSVDNLRRRLEYLHEQFSVVHYPPEFDKVLNSRDTVFKAFFDRLIFCKQPR